MHTQTTGVQIAIGTSTEEFYAIFVGFGGGLDWAIPAGVMVKVGSVLVSQSVSQSVRMRPRKIGKVKDRSSHLPFVLFLHAECL